MRFPIDVIYLSPDKVVVHLEPALAPWRFAPVRLKAASVLCSCEIDYSAAIAITITAGPPACTVQSPSAEWVSSKYCDNGGQ
jgi:uncharacterized membrane protein (UPF0127 family)